MRSLPICLAVAGLLAIPALGKADTFNFNLTGLGPTITGTLTASLNSSNQLQVSSINATGLTLLSPGSGPFVNDNLLLSDPSRPLDVLGLGFTQVIGGVTSLVNLYTNPGYNPPTNIVFYADKYDTAFNLLSDSQVNFSVAAVTPEPSSFLLLGTGILTAAAALRRRFLQ